MMFRSMIGASLALALVACAPDAQPQNPRAQTAPPQRRAVGQFAVDVDPGTGSTKVRSVGAATTGRGIHVPADVVQNGNPATNPPETFQVVTTSAVIGDGITCPLDENCFDVRVDSFLSRDASEVTLVIEGSSPPRVMTNPDAPPAGSGLSSPLGITTFGDIPTSGVIGVGSPSGVEEMRFDLPNQDPYTVLLTLYEREVAPALGDLFVTNFDLDRIVVHAASASGNASPLRTIGGPSSGYDLPIGIDVEGGEVFVGDFDNSSVRVFDATGAGDLAPLRVIAGGLTSIEGPLDVTVSGGEIFVANQISNNVTVFPIGASGNVAPSRVISGFNTQLSGTGGIEVAGGEIFVGNFQNQQINVYPVGANGDVAPTRTILPGMSSGLNRLLGLAVSGGELFVTTDGAIRVFAQGASGDATPLRVITGGNTTLFDDVFGIVVQGGEIYVVNQNRVVVFPIDGDGDIAPTRVIDDGVTPQLQGAWGLAIP